MWCGRNCARCATARRWHRGACSDQSWPSSFHTLDVVITISPLTVKSPLIKTSARVRRVSDGARVLVTGVVKFEEKGRKGKFISVYP